MPAHVFFDLDGTLTDSAPGITHCLACALEHCGHPTPGPTELRGLIGMPLRRIFAELLDTTDSARIEAAVESYVACFRRVGHADGRLYPGIRDALAALQHEGRALYVATIKSQAGAQRAVAHFRLAPCFRGIYGVRDADPDAHKSALLRTALEQHAIEPHDAVMVGDRRGDIEAARAVGIAAVAVAWGYGSESELRDAAPDAIVRDPGELLLLLGAA